MGLSVEALAAQIVREPDDVELRRVYADALQEAGDPRGEHIALAIAVDRGDTYAAPQVRAFERAATQRLREPFDKDHVVRLRWRHGFVEHVDIDSRMSAERMPVTKLRKLLAEPALLAVRSIDLRGVWVAKNKTVDKAIGQVIDLVRERPVHWVGIGDGAIGGDHIEALFAGLPRLDGIGLTTTDPLSAIGALARLPRLRSIDVGSRKLASTKLLDKLYGALPAKLESFGIHGLDDKLEAKKLAPILDLSRFPALRELGVFGPADFTHELMRLLLTSPLLPRLASFGFCAAGIYDDDTYDNWLRDRKARFAHVRFYTSEDWPDEDHGHESGRLGLIFKALDRPAEAIAECEHHLAFSGSERAHRGCWEELGEALVDAGRPEEAIAPLLHGIELFEDTVDDSSIYTYRTLTQAYDALERWEEAFAASEKALSHDKENAWTWRLHACALEGLERYDDAIAAYTKSIRYARDADDDDRPELMGLAYVRRAGAYWDLRRIDKALDDYALARKQGDDGATRAAWWAQGALERQRGDNAAARTCIERALANAGPNDQEPRYELGLVLYEQGEIAAALSIWQQAAAAEPAGWPDIDEQGHALLALGRPADALAALDAGPDKGGARACVLHVLGRTDDAIAAVEDYAHRPRLHEPLCVFRHVAGFLLQGLLHRAAGRDTQARELLARARFAPDEPRELHAAILAELAQPAPRCERDTCGRCAAAVAIAAALALGDRADASARSRALGAAVDAGSGRSMILRPWDLHAALPFLGADAPVLAGVLRVVERCTSGLGVTAALGAR